MRKLGAIAVISAGWVILPTLTLVSYFKALYNPPLIFLLPYVPGIFLYFLMLTQVITGSRLRVLDGAFGQPFVIRLHIASSILTLSFLALHVLVRFEWSLLGKPAVLLGLLPTLFVLALVFLAATKWVKTPLSVGKSGNYKRLRLLHNTLVPLCLLLWFHVVLSSVHEDNVLGTALVTAYFVIAVTLYLRHKQRSSPKGGIQGRIMSIQRADTVRIISLSIGELSRPLRFEPGQFGYLRIMDSALPAEEHPFSFSSASRDGFRMTIKAVGDYTSDLYEKCAPGTPVRITGPYGRFVYKPDGRGKSLFIAGGVGVTPFLSIIDTLKEQSLETPVHLLWLCSMETDFFDREEVEDAVQRLPLFDADFVIDKKGESISVNRLKTLAGNPRTCELFVCAPPPLMKHVRRCALSAGIGRRRIHHEAFSF